MGIEDQLKETAAGNLTLAIYKQVGGQNGTISKDDFNKFLNSIHVTEVTKDVTLLEAKEMIMTYCIRQASSDPNKGASDVCRDWKADLGVTFSTPTPPPPADSPDGSWKQKRRDIREQGRQELKAIDDENTKVCGNIDDENRKAQKATRKRIQDTRTAGKESAHKVNEEFQNLKPGGKKQGEDMTFGELAGSAAVEMVRIPHRDAYRVVKPINNGVLDVEEKVVNTYHDAVAEVKKGVEEVKKEYQKAESRLKTGARLFFNKVGAVYSTVTKDAKDA